VADKVPPKALLDAACVWSPDMNAQAVEVLRRLPPSKREQAGAIYARTGPEGLKEYCYSLPVEGTNDDFQFASEKGLQLAGMFHTHPDDKHSEQFSPNDTEVATTLKRPSFILDKATQDVRRFDPGTTRPDRRGMSPGQVVGNVSRRDALVAAYDLHNPPTKP
jgi:hypothetical protein